MKRLISLVVAFVIFAGILPVYANDCKIIVNEVFDDYALNEVMSSDMVKGTDARVVYGDKNDKALYCKIRGSSFNVSIPAFDASNEMIYSFDLKITGAKIYGDIMKQGTVSLMKLYNSGQIKMDNGLYVGGYGDGKWHTYTIAIDYNVKKYSLWSDGKLVADKRLLSTNQSKPDSFKASFVSDNADEETEIFIDNVRVYTGGEVLDDSDFPSKKVNNEILEFTETPYTEPVAITYMDSYGKNGIKASFAPIPTVEWKAVKEGDVESMHFVQAGLSGTYVDITPDIAITENKFVYQTDVYPVSMENGNIILCRAIVEGGYQLGYSNLLYINKTGNLVCNGTNIAAMPYGKWSTVAIAVDLNMGEGDIYINGNLAKNDVALHNGGVVPATFRVGLETVYVDSKNEFYVNAIKIYNGDKLREFDNSAIVPDSSGSGFNFNFVGESETKAKDILGRDAVFMTNCDNYFLSGQRLKYADFGAAAYEDENGVAMVPSELVAKAVNSNITYASGKLSANGQEFTLGNKFNGSVTLDAPICEKDGVCYVPVLSFVKNVLKKYAYTDGRGFVIISSQQRDYVDSEQASMTEEDSDIVCRYMQFDRPDGDALYDAVKKSSDGMHPRMFLRKDQIPAMRAAIDADSDMKKELRKLIEKCEEHLNSPVIPYEFVENEGPRLFGQFQQIRLMIFDLGVAYYATGDERYLERIWKECENVLSWEHWNLPENGGSFLDSGEVGAGIGMAYDILYDWLSEEQRDFFREKIQEKYLDYCVGVMEGTKMFKINDGRITHSNWGAVCGGSMFLTAMAFIDDLPEGTALTEKCKFVAAGALQAMEFPMGTLFPDGAVGEGMQYWQFYVENLAWVLNACINMCGDDFGFLAAQGLYEAISYGMNVQTVNGAFDFSATTPGIKIELLSELFAIAGFYNDDASMQALKSYLNVLGTGLGALGLLFYRPVDESALETQVPVDNYFPGEGVITMRSSYLDTAASYVGILAGHNGTDHQFDKGSFILELGGSRWICDLGDERKDVAGGYYHGDGFSLYKRRTEGHNALVVNPHSKEVVDELIASGKIKGYSFVTDDPGYTGQAVGYSAKVKRFESKPKGAITVLDLNEIYGTAVENYDRGYWLTDDRHAFTLRDEVTFTQSTNDVYWYLHMRDSEIKILDQNNVLVQKDGRTLRIEILTDMKDYKLEVKPADPLDLAMIRTGGVNEYNRSYYKKLAISGKCGKDLTISARFYVEDGNEYGTFTPQPIAEWVIPDGEIMDEPKLNMVYINGSPIDGFNPEKSDYPVEVYASGSLPVVTADVPFGNTAVITQPKGTADDAVIVVTNPVGRKKTYTIKFKYTEKIVNNIMEIESVLGLPDNAKLLKGANVSATHVPETNNMPANTQDGDFVSRWTSDMSGAALTVDLGEVKQLSGFALAFFYGDERTYKYDLLISEDGYTYTRILRNAESSSKSSEYEYLKANVKARYIRYVGYGHSAGAWNNLSEFRACEAK